MPPGCSHRVSRTDFAQLFQILFYRGISDRDVDQCSLKARDDLVVFRRIDGDAAEAPPQHAVILGAITSCRVPVRVDDPFSIRRVVDVTIVRGHTLEDANDHVSINGFVVAIHDRPVMARHLGRRGYALERTQRDHVRVPLKAFEFDGSRVGSIAFSMRREVGGDLT
jgi:hypothetical protein